MDFKTREKFKREVVVDNIPDLLAEAIEFIAYNLEPDDVFKVGDLQRWAERNGYVEETK